MLVLKPRNRPRCGLSLARRWLRQSSRQWHEQHDVGHATKEFAVQPCHFSSSVEQWTDRAIIRSGLCPWARRSKQADALRYVTCDANHPDAVARFVANEARQLVRRSASTWSTTLVVCPHVEQWNRDCDSFDSWVNNDISLDKLERLVSLVVFHPDFTRWCELDPGIQVGSTVRSHYETSDGERSLQASPAEITTLDPVIVGARRVGLKFLEDSVEQWVPMEWLLPPATTDSPLIDNLMHRAPYPTVHLIRRRDLKMVQEVEGGYEKTAELQMSNSRRLQQLDAERLQDMFGRQAWQDIAQFRDAWRDHCQTFVASTKK